MRVGVQSIFMILMLSLAITTIARDDKGQESIFFFEASNDIGFHTGAMTGKILNMVELGPDMSMDAARVQGQLLALFGEPAYASKDLEMAYYYVVIARTDDNKEFVLSAYRGPSGPAIGGSAGIAGITEAAEQLRAYILSAQPSDYSYEGYYLDTASRIQQGVKDGRVFYFETAMSDEELAEAYRELFPDME